MTAETKPTELARTVAKVQRLLNMTSGARDISWHQHFQQALDDLRLALRDMPSADNNIPTDNEARLAALVLKRIAASAKQQPVMRLRGIDEYGPMLDWYKPWTDFPIGTEFVVRPASRNPENTGNNDE